MLEKHIKNKISDNLLFTPTHGQSELISLLAKYISENNEDKIFLIKGYAGTGKTSIINAFVKTLDEFKIKSHLLAPTGRAAKILTYYTKKTAFTIHKKIYRQKSSNNGFGNFSLNHNPDKNTYFIIDEASMISNSNNEMSVFGSGRLLNDLFEYVYQAQNCKLIFIGDTAQLPPIGINISPALDKEEVNILSGKEVQEVILTDVVRQTNESGILYNATLLRELIDSNNSTYPKFIINNFPDIIKLSGEDLIEEISSCHSHYGIEETMIICRSNKRANKFNQGIRNMILYREEEISSGDYLMIVKNNYFWTKDIKELEFIANGDIVEVVRIIKHIERYGFRYAEVTLRFPDYKDLEFDTIILLSCLDIDTAALNYEENKKMFFNIAEDYADFKYKKIIYEKVKNNEFFNALQVKFAYAVTCHKAQGGQWDAVFVDQPYITDEMINIEYYRWLYTAITRASKKLYLVNFKDEFF